MNSCRSCSIILLAMILFSCAEKRMETRPELGPMTESVYASVKIEPVGFYDAYSAMPGILEEIIVKEGDSVVQGQLIAKIRAENSTLSRKDAALAAELARENYKGQANVLQSFAKEMESVEEQFLQDSLNLARQQRLWKQEIGSKVQLEAATLKADMSRNTLSRLKVDYLQKENELKTGYNRALNNLDRSSSSLSDFEIRSRMSGMVYEILKEEGEQVGTMEPVARVGAGDAFLILMAIDEVDVARLRVGQKIWLTLDAYEGQVFEAELDRIIPVKNERTQTFTVEALFVHPPEVLYAGLSGEANIVLAQRASTMTIPLDYLLVGNKVLTDDGEVEVEVGMRNLDRVEVKAGIDSSTVILKPE